MSERQTTVITVQPPEQGKADVAAETGVALTPIDVQPASPERTSVQTEISARDRAVAITNLEGNVDTFKIALTTMPESGAAYTDKADFVPMMELIEARAATAKREGSTDEPTLDTAEMTVFTYMKSELFAASLSTAVDHKSLDKPTIAFPDKNTAKAGKIAYIIEDLKAAAVATSDEKAKATLQNNIVTMESFAKVIAQKETAAHGNAAKKYIELVSDVNADPSAVKAAKDVLETFTQHKFIEGAAYDIIAQYFPADQESYSRVTLVPTVYPDYARDDEQYPVYSASASSETQNASSETPSSAHSEVQKPASSKELAQAKTQLDKQRSELAVKYAKREKSRIPNGHHYHDYSPEMKAARQNYDKALWESFYTQNKQLLDSDENMAEKMIDHIIGDAQQLEEEKYSNIKESRLKKLNTDESLFETLKKDVFTEEILRMLDEIDDRSIDADGYVDEREWKHVQEAFTKVQDIIAEHFEGKIKDERTWKAQRAIGTAAVGARYVTVKPVKAALQAKTVDKSLDGIGIAGRAAGRATKWAAGRVVNGVRKNKKQDKPERTGVFRKAVAEGFKQSRNRAMANAALRIPPR